MDAAIVARWRALCLVLLGAFLGMSLVIGAIGLLPGDVPLHDEILKGRGTALHAIARWVDYGGKWIVLAPAMALLFVWSRAARRRANSRTTSASAYSPKAPAKSSRRISSLMPFCRSSIRIFCAP